MNIKFRPVSSDSKFIESSKKYNLDSVLARIYAARGVNHYDDLKLELKKLHHYDKLKGINDAVNRLVMAIKENERILIIGDFDADGATSTAVAVRGLKLLGAKNVNYLVPNRFEYGYGLTVEIVEEGIKLFNPNCIVTVDNGIANIEGVAYANKYGVDVVITDHHLPADSLPDACAIVNPNQVGCDFPSKNLAGVGVIFYTLLALRKELDKLFWFDDKNKRPNLSILLDLVALGTVADVVPLDENNRVLVAEGLKRIKNQRACEGVKSLIKVAKRDEHSISAQDFGFALGPRLNAAGRLDDMTIGIQCLLADDSSKAMALALELDGLNTTRKEIESGMKSEAKKLLKQVYKQISINEYKQGLALYDSSWHPGVVGILASRIKEQSHCPVICFTEHDDNIIKGSARSIPGINIRDVLDIISKKYSDLIISFGGHAMAAGLSIYKDKLSLFREAFSATTLAVSDESIWKKQWLSDGNLDDQHISLEFAELLQESGPWGQHFPEPCFNGEAIVVQSRLIANRHWKLSLKMVEANDIVVDAIYFNPPEDMVIPEPRQSLHILYKLGVNQFRGNISLQLMIDDLHANIDELLVS